MELFPFTAEEWARVSEAARAVVNATLAEDSTLRASKFSGLRTVLADLQAVYGEHPVLLETEADFTDAPPERVTLYEKALGSALASGLPTFSIRMALARVLLEELHLPGRAMRELEDCRDELTAWADECERAEWWELRQKCKQRIVERS